MLLAPLIALALVLSVPGVADAGDTPRPDGAQNRLNDSLDNVVGEIR